MLAALLLLLIVSYMLRAGVRRRRGHDADLPAFLADAEIAGLITAEQRQRLLEHAAATAGTRSRMDGARTLGVLAGLFVVAGVSLIIATNWEDIGPGIRITAFVVLLAAIGEAAIRWRDRALGVSVPLELLWMFLPLLGIGLYAQTFQLSGDPVQPYLLWLALTAPIAWLSARPIAAVVHTAGIAVVLMLGNFAAEPGMGLFGDGRGQAGVLALTNGNATFGAWMLSLVMLTAMAVQSLRLLPPRHRHHFVGVIVGWLMCVLAAPTPLQVGHGGWLAVAAMALTTGWTLVMAAARTSMEERAASFFAWVACMYGLSFTYHFDRVESAGGGGVGVVLVLAVAAASLAGAWMLPPDRLTPLPSWAGRARLLVMTPLVASFAMVTGSVGMVFLSSVVMNLALFTVAIALMWHGSIVREPRQVNAGVLLLVVMLITRFFDLFLSMLTSGVGFIVAGLLLAGLSWLLERTRRRLIGAPPEVAP